jgi:hypothetical protein
VFFTEELESECESLETRLATVLVAKAFDALTLWVEEELSAVAKLWLFALLEDSPKEEDFCADADSAS